MKTKAPASISIKKFEQGIAEGKYYSQDHAPLTAKGYKLYDVQKASIANNIGFTPRLQTLRKNVKVADKAKGFWAAFAGKRVNLWACRSVGSGFGKLEVCIKVIG